MSLTPIFSPVARAVLVFIDKYPLTTDLTTYTFSISTGVVSGNRKLHLSTTGYNSALRTVTSVKVHVPDVATEPTGISATRVTSAAIGTADHTLDWWVASVPTGTAAQVVVVFSGAMAGAGLGVWASTGANATATDVKTDGTNPLSQSVTAPVNGFILAVAQGLGGVSYSWSGTTEETGFDTQIDGIFFSGSSITSAAGGAVAVAATPSAFAGNVMSAVAFGPG